ncbi:21034_t:CDS:2 [Dentiscutata erythropus]|uniref:21034_t:CDS:1 n=1 Tax=Dentiscutata erythropus TaxID=1348616 RepID=A0A9N9NNI3_9GLOM|nr:21034_t:CDS:2 [Dentiscutata erythropus]
MQDYNICNIILFLEEKLCNIWQYDQSHERSVKTTYVDMHIDVFEEEEELFHIPEATTLLQENNGFLPPMIKGHDKHFLNPIYILEHFNQVKILFYDKYYSTILEEMHQRLCCSEYGKYFPTLTFVQKHKQSQHTAQQYLSLYTLNLICL